MEVLNLAAKEVLNEEKRIRKWLKQLTKYRIITPKEKKDPIIIKYDKEDDVSQEDFKHLVEKEAYFISLNELSKDELIWLLAERRLSIQKGYDMVTEDEIRALAEEIHNSGCSRDELCWLNAEIMVLYREKFLV
ncbi:MAG: hypothetical protein ACFFAS_05635 [Promethearchaeota archaeon]